MKDLPSIGGSMTAVPFIVGQALTPDDTLMGIDVGSTIGIGVTVMFLLSVAVK